MLKFIISKNNISSTTFTLIFICLLSLSFLPVVLINYFTDIYGLRSTHNKRVENLISEEKFLYPLRVKAKAPYYVVGTSRTRYIDYDRLSKYLDKHCIRLGLSSAMLYEWIFLIKKIKANSSNFILGFDAFSLNINGFKPKDRLKDSFKQSFSNPYFGFKSATKAMKEILNLTPYDIFFTDFDKKEFAFTKEEIRQKMFVEQDENHLHYKNFDIAWEQIRTLAQLTDKNDIIIIFPKYYAYYHFFQKYDNIESKYFESITYLVKHTNAKIWSFYGINSITLNKANFDDEGWHFKPKVGKLIMARIFNDTSIEVPVDFGVLLTKDNVESYLSLLNAQIQSYHNTKSNP